jgi:hypothetical protein
MGGVPKAVIVAQLRGGDLFRPEAQRDTRNSTNAMSWIRTAGQDVAKALA